MKKSLSILIIVMLTATIFGGCGNNKTESSFKIGVIDEGSADATSVPMYSQLEKTVEALGGEVVYATMESPSADGALQAVENLLSKGVDGLVLSNFVSIFGLVPTVAEKCNSAEVYWSLYWTSFEEGSDTQKAALNSPYFISNTYEDDVYSAYFATKVIAEQGARNICVIGLPTGMSTTTLRDKGIADAVAEFDGMKILGEERDPLLTTTSTGGADIVSRFIAAYPEIDGIVIAGMTQFVLPGVVQAIESAGKTGEIKIGAIDFNEYQTDYMETGALTAIIGGHFAGPSYSAILIANAIKGTPLTDGPVSLKNNFIEISNLEDAKMYDEKVYNKSLYSDEEIENCLKGFNPDFTYEDLKFMAESYSLEDIISRSE